MESIILPRFKKICLKSIILPIIFFIVSIIIFLEIPIIDLLFPPNLTNNEEITEAYDNDTRFATITFDKLYYSNFDYYKGSKKIGSYYYSISSDNCIFVLISTEGSDSPPQIIEDYATIAKLSKTDDSFDSFLSSFSQDINWTEEGLQNITTPFIVDQITYNTAIYYFLFFATIIIFFVSMKFIISDIIYYIKPDYYPAFVNLKKFGLSHVQCSDIEDDLKNNLVIQINSIYITQNYLIEFGFASMDVIPIKNIIWMYKFSQWGHTVKSHSRHNHNLCIYTAPYRRFILHRKKLETVNEVIDYFNNKYPDILTEFTQEHHTTFNK